MPKKRTKGPVSKLAEKTATRLQAAMDVCGFKTSLELARATGWVHHGDPGNQTNSLSETRLNGYRSGQRVVTKEAAETLSRTFAKHGLEHSKLYFMGEIDDELSTMVTLMERQARARRKEKDLD